MAAASTVQAPTVSAIATSTPKKKAVPATKSAVTAHPSTAVMVLAAITDLKEKKGSSLSAIKKYISTKYNVDTTKLALFIRKFLKAAVIKGSLVQTNGNGAMGHFKLPVEIKKPSAAASKKKKAIAAKKPAKVTSAGTPKKRKLAAKKTPTASEPAAKKPKTVTAKPKKSLVKSKKVVAAPKPPMVKKTTTAVKKTKTPKKK